MEQNDNEQIFKVKIENIWFQKENLTIESHWRCTIDVVKYPKLGYRYMMMNKYYALIECKVDNTYFILSSPYSYHVLPIPVPNPSKPKTQFWFGSIKQCTTSTITLPMKQRQLVLGTGSQPKPAIFCYVFWKSSNMRKERRKIKKILNCLNFMVLIMAKGFYFSWEVVTSFIPVHKWPKGGNINMLGIT